MQEKFVTKGGEAGLEIISRVQNGCPFFGGGGGGSLSEVL